MGITAYWHDDTKTIMRLDYIDAWTLDEFYESAKQAHFMIGEVTHSVDLIINMRDNRTTPAKILSSARHMNELVQPNQRLTIMVGSPPFVKALIKVANQIMPKITEKLRYVNTLDEAFAIIQRQDSKVK
ncbi:MAG: hypothetical protein H7Y09_00470 [Chitinophagaceae bacterium]|nr:hypothetical protein [Anaerolineae bacterium]